VILDILKSTILGYSDSILALWILAVAFVIGKTMFFVFKRYFFHVKKEDEGKGALNEHIVNEVKWPFYLIIASTGFYYASKSLKILTEYKPVITNGFIIFAVLLGIYITKRAINALIVWYAGKDNKRIRIEQTALMSLKNFVGIFIYGIGIIIILGQFGVDISLLVASLGIGGLAIALALQPTLSNYFAGIYIASDKTIRLGDYIELDPERRGHIERMTWRSVWIRTLTENMVIVPNSKLSESTIINYSQPKNSMLIKVPVGVAYGSDLDKVERVSLKVARRILKRVGGSAEGEEPFLRFREFGDSNINFIVLFKIKKWEYQYEIIDEYIKALKKEFDKEGIEISFPCRNLYNKTT
jgi:small-conductance mechanosensitive channel